MRVLVLFNPVSGAGRAESAVRSLIGQLHQAGHEAEACATRIEPADRWLGHVLQDVDLAIVAGGDGAVRMMAGPASRSKTPIYHLPFGTENLFARAFGMNRSAHTLKRAIERNQVVNVDVGDANGRVFVLMASVGFDADVVHDLARRRGASISQWSYVQPILAQLRRWTPPCLTITVDGRRIDDGGSGFVVVSNCKEYGWRLNPAPHASMSDGLLDVTYFRARSAMDLIAWAVKARCRVHVHDPRLVNCRGRCVTIASPSHERFQLDGDPPDHVPEADERGQPLRLEITVRASALPVLTVPGGGVS